MCQVLLLAKCLGLIYISHLYEEFFRQALAPKCQVLLLAKLLGLYSYKLTYEYAFKSVPIEDTTAQLQSELADMKTRPEVQESETRKADSKFKFSLEETKKRRLIFKR